LFPAEIEKENMRMKFQWYAPLVVAACLFPCARAQSSFDLNIGGGTAHSGATGLGIDNANSLNAFGSCALNSGDPNCQATPSLGGFFLGIGGDVMLTKRYGVGAEVAFQPNQPNYGPMQYRQTFYDFNGIYSPLNVKRAMVQIQGGIGGSHTGFSFNQSGCVGIAVCTQNNLPVGTANHFAVHVGIGLQVFVTGHWFVRPQFDYRYIPNFDQIFSSNSVPEGMVWVGYSFGER
jgi:opacity protein-like surface antigen